MNTTDQTTNQIISQTTGRTRDHLDVLGDGPLLTPVWRLWDDLDALMQAGRLRGVELDLAHPACPCFLLDVAPALPRLYVELFLDEADEDEADEDAAEGETTENVSEENVSDGTDNRPLLVLVNWLGEDADPAIFEVDSAVFEKDPSHLGPDLAPVLEHVLRMTQGRQA